MLLAAFPGVFLSCMSMFGMCLSLVLLVFPISYFYGWWKTGRMPELGPALGAFLLGRIAFLFVGLLMGILLALGLMLLAMAGLIERPSGQPPQVGLGMIWASFIGMAVIGMIYLVLAARVCGWIYNLLCRRHEGFDVAMFDLGLPFGLSMFVSFIGMIAMTITGGPPPEFMSGESPTASTSTGPAGTSFPGPGSGSGFPGPAGGTGQTMPGASGGPPGLVGPGASGMGSGPPEEMMPSEGQGGGQFGPGGSPPLTGDPGQFGPPQSPSIPGVPGRPGEPPGAGSFPGEPPGGPGTPGPFLPGRPGSGGIPGIPGPGNTPRLPSRPGFPTPGNDQKQPSSVPETLLGKAEYLLRKAEADAAWQYAWAAYLMEEEPSLKSAVKWCSALDRPVLGMPRIGVAVMPRGVPFSTAKSGENSLGPLAVALPDVAAALLAAAENSGTAVTGTPWIVFVGTTFTAGSHIATLARLHHVDLVLVLELTRKRRGRRYDLQLQLHLYEPGKPQPVWKSQAIRSSQYQKLKAQGTDLLQQLSHTLASELKRRYSLSARPSLAPGDVPGYVQKLARSIRVPAVEKAAILKYLVQQGAITQDQAAEAIRRVTISEVDIMRPNPKLESWLKGRLPPVR